MTRMRNTETRKVITRVRDDAARRIQYNNMGRSVRNDSRWNFIRFHVIKKKNENA